MMVTYQLNFGIPAGAQGATGPAGKDGTPFSLWRALAYNTTYVIAKEDTTTIKGYYSRAHVQFILPNGLTWNAQSRRYKEGTSSTAYAVGSPMTMAVTPALDNNWNLMPGNYFLTYAHLQQPLDLSAIPHGATGVQTMQVTSAIVDACVVLESSTLLTWTSYQALIYDTSTLRCAPVRIVADLITDCDSDGDMPLWCVTGNGTMPAVDQAAAVSTVLASDVELDAVLTWTGNGTPSMYLRLNPQMVHLQNLHIKYADDYQRSAGPRDAIGTIWLNIKQIL